MRWPSLLFWFVALCDYLYKYFFQRYPTESQEREERLRTWFLVYYTSGNNQLKLLNCNIHSRLYFMVFWRVLLFVIVLTAWSLRIVLNNDAALGYVECSIVFVYFLLYQLILTSFAWSLYSPFHVWPHIRRIIHKPHIGHLYTGFDGEKSGPRAEAILPADIVCGNSRTSDT